MHLSSDRTLTRSQMLHAVPTNHAMQGIAYVALHPFVEDAVEEDAELRRRDGAAQSPGCRTAYRAAVDAALAAPTLVRQLGRVRHVRNRHRKFRH